MKVLIISGSPKGKNSVTLQSMLYLEKYYDTDDFSYIDAGAKIRSYEKDFSEVKSKVDDAEVIVFSYPVYTCLATSQLHRFLELMHERGVSLVGKTVTQFTTSKHFYDMTAHRAVELNAYDLGANYVRGMSADMNDLTTKKGQKELTDFWDFVRFSHENGVFETPPAAVIATPPAYTRSLPEITAKNGKTVALITNCKESDIALRAMIDDFIAAAPFATTQYNIADMKLRGGCLGCLNCAASGNCVYTDGFQQLLREKLETADAMVFAFTPSYHTMGTDFKTFDDRRFCNGHRTTCEGKPTAYIVGGSLVGEENLRQLLDARPEIAGNYPAGIATTDGGADELKAVLSKLDYALTHKLDLPQNFYGEGGRRIFRDLVFVMQGIMRADHEFYKSHGYYDDLPQKQWKTKQLMKLAGIAFNNQKIRKKLGGKIDEGMLLAHKKAIDEIKK